MKEMVLHDEFQGIRLSVYYLSEPDRKKDVLLCLLLIGFTQMMMLQVSGFLLCSSQDLFYSGDFQ